MSTGDSQSSVEAYNRLYDNEDPEEETAAVSQVQNSEIPQENNKKPEKKDEDEEAGPPIGFFDLFRFSDSCDKCLIAFAVIISLCFGIIWPIVQIMFGDFLENFVNHAVTNTSNSTLSNNISDKDSLMETTATLCTYIALLGVVIFIMNAVIVCSFTVTASNQIHKIRCLFFMSLLRQEIGWYDTHESEDVASRLSGDLKRIQDGIGEKLGIGISLLSASILSVSTALFFGWKLGLAILSVTPILSFSQSFLLKVQASVSSGELQAYSAAGAVAEEVLSSIRTVIAFGGESKEIARYESFLSPARKKGIKRSILTALSSGVTWFCIFASYALAFWYGVKLIVEDIHKENPEYTPRVLLIVFFSVVSGSMFFGQSTSHLEAVSLAKGAARKVYSIIQRKPEIDSSSKIGDMPTSFNGSIELKNVYFNYPSRPDVEVIKDISFVVETGETIALVGSSGCGKSTIIQLILRFYDVLQGKIKIDGTDIDCLNVGWLRSNLGFVGQEPVLFSTTIMQNILYGKLEATFEEVENAAKLANIHDFINALPLKYNTLVGERGVQLSGGQKQRIALARALIKNPKVLLLDEATSALDTESESIVQAALDEASKGRTTIIVAHRLSTIKNADRIYVLAEGTIQETGTHEELMMKKGLYYNLVQKQINETDEGEEVNICGDSELLQRYSSIISSESNQSEATVHATISRQISAKSGSMHDESIPVQYTFKEQNGENLAEQFWSRLFKVTVREWPYILIGAISSLTMGLCFPVYGIVFGNVLGVFREETGKILQLNNFYCLIFLIMAVVSCVASFLQVFMFSYASENVTSRLRNMVFTKMISQDIEWFDQPENSVGSLCSKLSADASDMQGATGTRISTVLQAFATFIASCFVAAYFNYKIGLVVLCFIPLIIIAMYFNGRATKGQLLNEKDSLEEATKIAVEAIANIRTVASLHQEKTFYAQFEAALTDTYKNIKKRAAVRALTYSFAQSVQVFIYSVAFYYGSTLVANGEIVYSDLYKILNGIIVGAAMIGQAVAMTPDYTKAKAAAGRVFKILDLKAQINGFSNKGKILDIVEGNITFKDVKFSYPRRSNVQVLRGLGIEIKSGQTVALVGKSGCGKSTCIQLIERFYDVQHGEIMLDDENIKNLNVSNLRKQIGLVSQEPVLFGYTIAENIAYGDNSRHADMNEIIECARQANIHSFIVSLPQGYDTDVGASGTQLSGGQKQRIAIARALLRKPKVLLLDEATSALDAESEQIVQEALDRAKTGRTCLIIAHRLSTIQNADLIAVIHKGKIVEQGTHQELLKKQGHYFNLYNSKFNAKS